MDKEWLKVLLGPHDRMVGRLRFQHANTCWRVWNLHNDGAWVFVGMLDKVLRYEEDDEHLTARAVELAKRRHERLEGV